MNLILLDPAEIALDGTARLLGRRATHLVQVLRATPGDAYQVGVLAGRMGWGEVIALGRDEAVLRITLDRDPPPRATVDLLLAVPRPKILRRVLHAAASLGVRRLALVGSYRVEKSYFGSPLLAPEALARELRLGLEQGRDTIPPEVLTRRFFKPFVEDELDALFPASARLLADPGAERAIEAQPPLAARAVVAIGPEGGWTRYEAEALRGRGFAPFTLGPRPLRVDVAVPYALAQAELWLRR